jgi:hypothetical protein
VAVLVVGEGRRLRDLQIDLLLMHDKRVVEAHEVARGELVGVHVQEERVLGAALDGDAAQEPA